MFAMNHLAVRMPFVLQKIKMQFASVHPVTEETRFQKLAVNWPMLVRIVPNRQFVKFRKQVKQFANAHLDIPDTQNRLDASQLVNVAVTLNARTALNV